MPQRDVGRVSAPPAKKAKKKVIYGPPVPKAKPKPTVVAPADRVSDRVEARKVQIQKSKSLSPDRQDTKRSPAQQKRDAQVVAANVKVSRARAAEKQKSVDDPGPVKLLPKYAKSRAVSKAETIGRVAPVLKVLDQTTRPLHAIAAGTDAAVQGRNVPKAVKAGIQNKDKTTFSTVLKHVGVKNKYVRGGAGFILDVGLDPTTYITGGTGSVARKAALKEGEAAGKAATGVTVKVAGKEVPGIRKATAKAGEGGGKAFRKVVPEKVRDATRNAASEVNPNIAPAGVDKATHQAARRVSRKARAAATKGEREAINLGRGIKSQVGEKNYQRVVDAVEAGDTSVLPDELRGHAETIRRHLAEIRQVQKNAGLKAPERKGYVPRKLTDRTLKAEQKTARSGGARSVELKSSKARKEQRPMAEVRATEPGRYREDLHALVAERMAEGTNAAARANLARDMADLGHEIPRGSRPQLSQREAVYKLKDGKLTEVDVNSKAFQKKPPKEGMKAKYVVLNKTLVDRTMGSVAPSKGGTIMHGYDQVQGGFKRIALATPGFHIRNAIGDTAQAYVHQPGQKLPGNMVRAGRVLKAQGRIETAEQKLGSPVGRGGKLKTKKYGHVTYEEAARRLVEAGAARSGYTSRELRELASSGEKKLKLPKSPGAVRRAFLNREDLPRLATAIHAVREGATWEEAAAKVADVHFDYADLTPFERNVARRIMPFYTWTARNVPLQSKRLLTNPGKYAAFQKVRENAAQIAAPGDVDPKTRDLYKQLEAAGVKMTGGWEKYLTSYEQRNAGVPVSWKGNKFTISAGLPLGDLNELPGLSGPGEYLNKAASLVTPIVKDPVEFGFNYSFFFRDQIERDNSPLVPAPSPVGKWPAWAKRKFGVVKAQDKRSGKMIWQWPGKADYVAHAVPGLPASAVKMMTPGHDQQGKGPAQKALGVAGIKATPVDATTNAINLAYARGEEIQKRQAVLRKQKNPANGALISAKNPTPEYARLALQLRTVNQIAFQGKSQRKDAVLPKQGGPPKNASTGRVRVPGVGGRVRVPGAGGRVKVP